MDVENFVSDNLMGIVYFSGSICGACDAIRDKVKRLIKDYEKINFLEINAVENKEIAAKYDVFTLPILILFVDGKEVLRFGRYFDMLEFKNSINRYYNMIF